MERWTEMSARVGVGRGRERQLNLLNRQLFIFRKFPPISGETLRLSSYYVVEVFGSAESNILLPKLTLTQKTLRLTLPSARKGGPAKWSGLDAFAFAVKVKRVAEIQSDFVAGAKS